MFFFYSFTFNSKDSQRSSIAALLPSLRINAWQQRARWFQQSNNINNLECCFLFQDGSSPTSCLSVLETIFWVFPYETTVLLVLNGYDDCDSDSRELLIAFFSRMAARMERRLKVLITTNNPSCVLDELLPWPSLDIDPTPDNNAKFW